MTRPAAAVVLPAVRAAGYVPHALHGQSQVWVEKNCYADVWIELLQALDLDPHAMLPFTLAVDFEGDQWTFFKPPHAELQALYGVDVQELTVWRPVHEHLLEHLGQGKLVSLEVDAHWLPDTAGTDYLCQHVKTTIVVNAIDMAAGQLGYFHNAGYFELDGDDFRGLLRLDASPDPSGLPLFAEFMRIDRRVRREPPALRARSRALLADHVARRPATNPLARFGRRLEADLPDLLTRGLPYYHAWAFASVRQCGSAFDLAAAHLRWLDEGQAGAFTAAADACARIAQGSKALILKLARSVNAQRAFDTVPLLSAMAADWDAAMAAVERELAA